MSQTANTEHKKEMFKGVFSLKIQDYIGAGSTKRKVTRQAFFFAEEREDGMIDLKPLNDNFIPTGTASEVEREVFVEQYKPEPEVYSKKTVPALKKLTKTMARAERLRRQGEPFSAEFEFKNALSLDETNIRATFGLGLTYLDRGETELAGEIMHQLVELDETFHSDNKHLFNEFGIKLRKNSMFDQALEYYKKALKISANDENLFYNMARTFFEKKDMEAALEHISKALELNPSFSEAASLDAVIRKKIQASR